VLDEAVCAVNRHLEHHETVEIHRTLPASMTIGSGQPTPTTTVQRRIIGNDDRAIIEKVHAS
jgi:hypothetical protein